ncbi:hypothetical protein LSCM1_07589 [Leishmania martiniquensis]|uniref:Uncharacterized protein n=1 Tax=Leishmania martiniquensis TaxID=1580590 RepID=A0A836H467_9TRYP|nr:hypothetical protein LSCM1_07589 [Leishmania martiniquensis]
MFPQGLIDQWLSKSREGRRSVREDPKATPAILDNINRLEEYCRSHPYDVFCASTLQNPPFALHALESEAAERQRLAQPPPVLSVTVPSPSAHATAFDGVGSGVCGRYADGEVLRTSVAAAAQHLHNVATRLAAYLRSSGLVKCAAGQHEEGLQCTVVANFFVRLLSEAAVAAVYRQGIAAQIEAEDRAVFQHRQSQRRLQLHVTCKYHIDPGRRASSESKGTSAEAVRGADDLTVARPIADHRRLSQGLVSLWGSLTQRERHGEQAAGGPPLQKRSRDGTADAGPADSDENLWTRVRVDCLRRWLGGRPLPPPPPPPPGTASRVPSRGSMEAASPGVPGGGWSSRLLHISKRDVEFALRKVLTDATAPAVS